MTIIAAGKRAPENTLTTGNIGTTSHLCPLVLLLLPGRDTALQIALQLKLLPPISCPVPPNRPYQTNLFNPAISSLATLASVPTTIFTPTKGKSLSTMQRKRSYAQIARGENNTASNRQPSVPSSANLGPASANTAQAQPKKARVGSRSTFLFLILHL